MPGAPAKIGQLLGMRAAEEIPSPSAMSIEEVKNQININNLTLAKELEDISDWSKAASIGQTHLGHLKSGQEIAIKIQYPNVAKALGEQIDAVFGLAGFSPAKKYEFDAGQTKNFLRERMLAETDYRLEAEVQNRFFVRYRNSFAIVPEVYKSLTSDKVLTQSWEDSVSLYKAKEEFSYAQSCKAAYSLTQFVLDSLFGLGIIHTDLNPGNFGFRIAGNEVKVVIYDFGSTFQLKAETGLVLFRWIDATSKSDSERIMQCMVELGFDRGKLSHIEGKLLPLSIAVLAPFLEGGPWTASAWRIQDKIDAILGSDKWWFRTAGPPWFLYFMRTVQGWHHALMTLDATISFENIWWPWKQQLESIALFYNLRQDGSGLQQNATSKKEETSPLNSKSLRVLVSEGTEEIVDLTLPARAVEDLEELVPAGVGEVCRNQGIILSDISRKAIDGGGFPQQLFSAEHGKRVYKVWLE
jgi:hypothetical protein